MKEPEKKKLEELFNDSELKSVWDLSASYTYNDASETDVAWSKMLTAMNTAQPVKVSWIKRNMWLSAAAASLAIIVGAIAVINANKPVVSTIASIKETTQSAELKTITLSDGSVVYMNSNSQLLVESGFGETNRNITLVGEARFEVAKNENLPFTVVAGATHTSVLGTGFTISAYENEDVKIAVFHGKVSFSGNNSNLILTQGNLAAYQSKGLILKRIFGDTSSMAIESDLVFKRATLEEISLQVKHRYGKTLKYDAVQSQKIFTGRFVQGTTPDEIAATLAAALQISVTIE